MSAVDDNYQDLCHKLEIFGYNQPLPSSAAPLVGILLEDLIKTTESLRNTKLEVLKYMEEKSCWELGVEPYKCDNSKLLSECNALHLELIKQRDEFDEKIIGYRQEIRNLEADKRHFEEHCAQLEKHVRDLLVKVSGNLKNNKNDVNMSKRPFISTVKSGKCFPSPSEPSTADRCSKCSSIDGKVQEVQLLQNGLHSQADQISCLKEKLERRDREISRLNDLLVGGRPLEALAQDCCYKNVATLSEDVEELQKEKVELLKKYRDAQNSMHEAMQRAIALEEKNKQIERDLTEFQKEALSVESEANAEIAKKENEISSLRKELEKLKACPERDFGKSSDEKRRLYEQLNSLTQTEKELMIDLDRMKKKNTKLKNKIQLIQKSIPSEDLTSNLTAAEEEAKRYKYERDFFQREYLKLVENYASNKEFDLLKRQLESKENEITVLSKELLQFKYNKSHIPDESRSSSSHSVQAAIMRAERERDVVKEELRMVRSERDCLRDKLDCVAESQMTERCRIEEENRLLQSRICKLESEKRELLAAHIPEKTHLTLVREELEEMRRRVKELQCENHKLSTTNNQLRILQDQTEKALVDHQTKLLAAETNLENAESRLSTIHTTRESTGKEMSTLQREISILKSNNTSLEAEKDKIMSELDTKTEKIYQLEYDLKSTSKLKQELQSKVKVLEKKLGETFNQRQEYESELHETSNESKSLRDQIQSLRLIRDQTLAENCRLTNDLAETAAEARQIKQKLKDSEKEVEKLKQQLQQYVQEVKRAEELLLLKEQEREEMLEHYRSLSHDAVLLEGNNQSLEIETAEQRQQLCDAQTELDTFKTELAAKEECILKLENQVSVLSSQIAECQTESEQNYDELRLTKVELEASKELIAKLNVQCEKLNAELNESKIVRCQLENQVKNLRENMMTISPRDQVHFSSLEDLHSSTKKELEVQRKKNYQLIQEISSLKKKVADLEDKLSREGIKCCQNEILAKEYAVKIKELQQTLTESRFEQAKSSDNSPSKVKCTSNHSQDKKQNTNTRKVCRASAGEEIKKDVKLNAKSTSQAFASSFQAIMKSFSPDEERALEQDIKEFLNSEKILKDSMREYDEKISIDEDNSNIIVRRKRTIKTKAISSARNPKNNEEKQTVVSTSSPSNYKTTKESISSPSTPKNKSEGRKFSKTSVKSHSLSPRSFPAIKSEFNRHSKDLKTKFKRSSSPLKEIIPPIKQILSDPETTDYSKSLQMKTNHHFKGDMCFTTAFKVSPRRKDQKQNLEPTAKKSKSETNIRFVKILKNAQPKIEEKIICNSIKGIDNAPSGDYSSNPASRKFGLELKDSTYPKSSTTKSLIARFCPPAHNFTNKVEKREQHLKNNEDTSSVIRMHSKIPFFEIPVTTSTESKYNSTTDKRSEGERHIITRKDTLTSQICETQLKDSFKSVHSKSNTISAETTFNSNLQPQVVNSGSQESATSRVANVTEPVRTSTPESATGCSCMQNRKKQLSEMYNISLAQQQNSRASESMYYRKYRMWRSPTGGYDTESSSGFEKRATRKRFSRMETKNIDLSGLPPPLPFHRRSK